MTRQIRTPYEYLNRFLILTFNIRLFFNVNSVIIWKNCLTITSIFTTNSDFYPISFVHVFLQIKKIKKKK